jgi:transcription termination factor Rho
MNLFNLKILRRLELLEIARKHNILSIVGKKTKGAIIAALCYYIIKLGGFIYNEGIVEIIPNWLAFLRSPNRSYSTGPYDIFITSQQVKKYGLRTGDCVYGTLNFPMHQCRYFSMKRVININGDIAVYGNIRPNFTDLTPVHTHVHFVLEVKEQKKICVTARVIDLISPIGMGQRVLLVAPPKTGKTLMLQHVAHSLSVNYNYVKLIVLLVDERTEEVTEMFRVIFGTVVASTFDESALRHIQVASMTIEHAKRLVEHKKDVVILLDSITRLARAYNNAAPTSGKVLTGGIDSNCLQRPKRFFGAARTVKEGGSLTIIATALVETGSKMDDIIFEEFKGTGNSEIYLDRIIAEKRVFPAINIMKTGTRRDDLLLNVTTLKKVWLLRKLLYNMGDFSALEFLIDRLKRFPSNKMFCDSIKSDLSS